MSVDLFYLGVIVVFFLASLALAHGLEKLRRPQ
jgi:hypothetical protein